MFHPCVPSPWVPRGLLPMTQPQGVQPFDLPPVQHLLSIALGQIPSACHPPLGTGQPQGGSGSGEDALGPWDQAAKVCVSTGTWGEQEPVLLSWVIRGSHGIRGAEVEDGLSLPELWGARCATEEGGGPHGLLYTRASIAGDTGWCWGTWDGPGESKPLF